MAQHKPTEQSRLRVMCDAIAGFTQNQIADRMGISDDTLRKYYREELDSGVKSIVSEAVSVVVQEMRDGDRTSAFFILKCKGRWRETDTLEQGVTALKRFLVEEIPQGEEETPGEFDTETERD